MESGRNAARIHGLHNPKITLLSNGLEVEGFDGVVNLIEKHFNFSESNSTSLSRSSLG
jgi:hypothetical protein